MKLKFTRIRCRHTRAFTLIEILTVVAIIGILAGIMVPTVARARVRARVGMARLECANLANSIKSYHGEYSRFPTAYGQVANTAGGDVTFNSPLGMKHASGDPMDANPNSKLEVGPLNSDLVAILLAVEGLGANPPNKGHSRNPKKRQFFDGKMANDIGKPGVGPDGILRDIFGSPYVVTIDFSSDNNCVDRLYGSIDRQSVVVWSLGPDLQMNTSPGVTPDQLENADNVLSWK